MTWKEAVKGLREFEILTWSNAIRWAGEIVLFYAVSTESGPFTTLVIALLGVAVEMQTALLRVHRIWGQAQDDAFETLVQKLIGERP